MESVDVLIVGGGPAGLAAAIVLARAGQRVWLVEQRPFPLDKVCGEGLMPTGVAYLAQLGVTIEAGHPFAGIRYVGPAGGVAEATFKEGAGLGLRRTALSAALLRAAARCDSLCILEKTRAMPVGRVAEGVEVQVGRRPVRARLVIGADGLNSRVRRWAGLERSGRRHWRWGARRHFAARPWSDYVEVYWSGRGVEAYVTPVGPEQVGVAFLWRKGQFEAVAGGRGLWPSLLEAFPALQERLVGAVLLDEGAAVGPLQQRVKDVIADGVLLMGDAAGYLDGITGEGISIALAQALALEKTVVLALWQTRGLAGRGALAGYRAAHRSLARSSYQVTELVLLLSRYPRLCEGVMRALAAEPRVFQQLLSANMGLGSLWRPGVGLGLIRGALRAQRR